MSRTEERGDDAAESNTEEAAAGPLYAGRRALLRAAGAGVGLATLGGVAAADDDGYGGGDDSTSDDDGPQPRVPIIDPVFGYPGLSADEIPNRLSPDHAVELLVDPERLPPAVAEPEFGAFFFDPVGLHVDPGDIVNFELVSPEHTVTAYHAGQDRQQRVPESVPPLSSPVLPTGGFWLYRFDEPGVYDLFCAPHERFGMVVRVVVGEETEPVVRGEEGRPPLPTAATVLDDPALDPETVVDEGTVSWFDHFP